MHLHRHRLLLIGLVLIALAQAAATSQARAGIISMTLVDDGEKIGPATALPVSEGLQLFGMRNETIALQAIVQADATGAENLSLTVSGLELATIEIFAEDMIPIRERSHDLVWKPGSNAEPAGLLGQLPDRLVPMDGRTFSLAANQRAVFWIDIWIAPSHSSGDLDALIELVGDASCASCKQSLGLEMLDRSMPDRARARTMLWFSGGDLNDDQVSARYFSDPSATPEMAKRELRRKHYQLAKKHRITLFGGEYDESSDELRSLLSGRAFSSELGYEGPGQDLGQDLLVFEAYGGELTSEAARRWLSVAKAYKELRSIFVYVMDEPSKSDHAEINRRVQASRPMPAFVTSTYQPEIEADIFAAPAWQYSQKQAKAALAAGKQLWIYNGARPFSGSFAIDDVAISPRVNPWIQYKLGIERWFYWEATYYDDFQGQRGPVDLMADGVNFSNRHGDRINGDGLLMYPGRDMLFPKSDAGIDGPLASIRLKNWRRGIEDVEYLVMARAAGFDSEVDVLLETLLPSVLDETRDGRAVSWPEDGKSWRMARRQLFELLRSGRVLSPVQGRRPAPSPNQSRSWLWILGLAPLVIVGIWARRRIGKAHDPDVIRD